MKDNGLFGIFKKVRDGVRLSKDDGLAILATRDMHLLGRIADYAKRIRSGESVFFAINKHINYTNICSLKCSFCFFAKSRDEPGAYELSIDEIIRQLSTEVQEAHLVGGLNPGRDFSYYLEMVKRIRENHKTIGIKGFTAVEIAHFSRISGLSIQEVLVRLKDSGLTSLPGGGAEVFSPRVRNIVCPQKPGGDTWLAVHEAAHRLNIPTNATILYGHVETDGERVDHLLRLRQLQDRTGGFLCFVPLPFQKWGELPDVQVKRDSLPCEDLKMIALSRLMLDNFEHIKAYWIMLGIETSTIALGFGADDLDGTVKGERIAHSAGAQTPQEIGREDIILMIRDAGKKPVERDSLYRKR